MIKLVIFDIDGVLIDSREIHFEAFNMALKEIGEQFVLSRDEHLEHFDGLPTKEKLRKLVRMKNFPDDKKEIVEARKQEFTSELLSSIKPNHKIVSLFRTLRGSGIQIGVASNAIRRTSETILKSLELSPHVNSLYSNEDVTNKKPSAEMYLKCMLDAKCDPDETLILEDSPVGRRAAFRSGAHLMPIESIDQVNIDEVFKYIKSSGIVTNRWRSDKLNILIPMSGEGSRFKKDYRLPKPLIEIHGKPMIQWVTESLGIDAQYTFVIRRSHTEEFPYLISLLKLIAKNPNIVFVEHATEGAACTTLLAKEFIDSENPLLIANADQYIEWHTDLFMHKLNSSPEVDGAILTFENSHPKWSYAKTEGNKVVQVAEKVVISNNATVGIYWWRKGCEYVKYANQMIDKNIRTNNEFYVCPVFNEAIADGKFIVSHRVDTMFGLGTPEDVQVFLERK